MLHFHALSCELLLVDRECVRMVEAVSRVRLLQPADASPRYRPATRALNEQYRVPALVEMAGATMTIVDTALLMVVLVLVKDRLVLMVQNQARIV